MNNNSGRLYMMILIILAVLLQCSLCRLQPDRMDSALLQRIKLQQDYVHHFIFFNQQTFNKISLTFQKQIKQMHQQQDIQFYLNDCKSIPMKQCQTKDQVPLMLLYNRIFVRFNGGKTQNQIQQVYDWIVSRITTAPKVISTRQQLLQQLEKKPQLFCYCQGENKQQMAYFYSLSKAMILAGSYLLLLMKIDYCILQNITLYKQLGLKQGNVTLFKNGTIQNRIEYQYPNRYDVWEMFLKMNCLNHIEKSDNLIKKRFTHQNKNINTTIVICDFSFKCQRFWRQFKQWSRIFQQKYPQIKLAMTFFDQKQVLLYNVYFGTIMNYTKFPALLNIKILSQNGKSGWFRRYITYPQQQINENTIIKFVDDINNGKIQQVQLSGPKPLKNGFTGKHAQKLIQKVVANNLNQTIANSQKHYILLLSTFGVGCQQCQEFYKQYRKAASFLQQQDITFGFMDVLKNEVRIDNVKSIPQVLLYNKYFKQDPVIMVGRENFDSLLRFLENNAIINYTNEQM